MEPHRKILLLCPTRRAAQAISALARDINCQVIRDDRSQGSFLSNFRYGKSLNILELIDSRVRQYKHEKLDGITCAVAFPGMNIAAACIAQELNLPGPSPLALLRCEHKYYCRLAQEEFVPEAAARSRLLDPTNRASIDAVTDFPCFVKPVKSIMSSGAFRVNSKAELLSVIEKEALPDGFLIPFNDLISRYSNFEHDANYLIVEELLEGWQVSLEGYVYKGEVNVMGIVDAIMFPGTISFRRWQYPSSLSQSIQDRMADIARRFISGIKYDDWAFNIEMMYNPLSERIQIIEVNARLASQFWDLFEKVDGSNPYDVIMRLALGERPEWKRGQGRFNVAASCVLRTFDDRLVLSIPDADDVERLKSKYPDALVEILAKRGKRLSEQIQDSGSFRFGLVNIGADSFEAIERKFEDCISMLPYSFDTIGGDMVEAAAALPQFEFS